MCKNILILQIWKHMSVERWRIPTKLILILCKLHLPSSLRFIPSLTDTTLPLACLKTHPDHLCSSYTLQWGACPGAWSTCQGLKKNFLSSPNSYLLPGTPQLLVGLHGHLPTSMCNFVLAWASGCHVHAVLIAMTSHVLLPFCDQKTVFLLSTTTCNS